MTILIVYLLAAFGLAYILGHARISLGVRTWLAPAHSQGRTKYPPEWVYSIVELVECPACFGFWEGLGFMLLVLFNVIPQPLPIVLPAYPFVFCASGYLLGRLTGWIKE